MARNPLVPFQFTHKDLDGAVTLRPLKKREQMFIASLIQQATGAMGGGDVIEKALALTEVSYRCVGYGADMDGGMSKDDIENLDLVVLQAMMKEIFSASGMGVEDEGALSVEKPSASHGSSLSTEKDTTAKSATAQKGGSPNQSK